MFKAVPERLCNIFWYSFFVVLTTAILVAGQRLDRTDLRVPFNYSWDALLVIPLVKTTVETGTHWRNDRLGAPGVQELYDFPFADKMHFALLRLIGTAFPDPIVVFNLFHLLTYPLTTLITMYALRRLGLSLAAAGAGGVLYSFVPFHYLRGTDHYFLSAYFVIPVTCLLILRVCEGRVPFFRADPDEDGRYRLSVWNWDTLGALVVAVATASAGIYYAFYGCALLAAAGCYGWVVTKTWKVAAAAGILISIIVAILLVYGADTFIYQYNNGYNTAAHARNPEDAEFYGLKFSQLVMPVQRHNSLYLHRLRSAFDSPIRPLENENQMATLGLVGTAGLLVLLVVGVLPERRPAGFAAPATLTLIAILLGTVGGFGSVFNFLVTSQIRAYNRISIYIAFLAIYAVVRLLDGVLSNRPGWVRWPAFGVLIVFGIWDQTNDHWFRGKFADHRAAIADEYHADEVFFGEVERALPGGSVFTLPMIPFPETNNVGELHGYDHARGYLHTKTVRWSFGAIRGREEDQWQREVSTAPAAEMLRRVTLRGFDGLFVDRRGYAPADADKLLADLRALLGTGTPPLIHPAGNQLFFDLRPYREKLRSELGADAFAAAAKVESEQVRVLWLNGFHSTEGLGYEWRSRWCSATGQAVFVNPTDRPRTIHLYMAFRTNSPDPSDVQITGGELWTDRFPVNNITPPIERTIVVPPGRHTVRFRCRPPKSWIPFDARRLMFCIIHIRPNLTE
ncbi:hypothetical protein [Fimbriiglobus ruber]|nr:hypothetical protein [Fimbriiglobus ruber]